MIGFLNSYAPLLELALFNALLAFSQYVVLRAGVFSLGTAAFAALGAYAAAILATKLAMPTWLGLVAAFGIGTLAGALVAIPLARLRGVFQALATLALVQIVLSITLNWVDLTEGALGINSIPKTVGLVGMLVAVVVVGYFLAVIGSSSIGRAFDIIREDETVAVSLGISVPKHHMIAFILSGAIAGLAGGLHAYNSYSITPNEYGFNMLVIVLAMVVLGGRVSIWGPLVGAVILTVLPELLRGFQEYRMVVQGALLMVSIVFLPRGVADTALAALRRRRIATAKAKTGTVTA
ncbi:branched-chain amino acid ABC transporter permease [Kumtagia ephedrae]|jgi:branched-chain amino acid transport system permease protein|uniref:Branched-chain amino acid ABC transporter permease n=1 Tax=Kumtagia ephedrae TaxID=2116701 RepID=A0A2P7SSE6_9HYPH|nr:branched-chain amino acid ABC transporter permease [Mesorhizobium ephedrae]PSJ65255.1 branched-chain amino acid ABC transporter permease [Mesorhizobium ephedrae]